MPFSLLILQISPPSPLLLGEYINSGFIEKTTKRDRNLQHATHFRKVHILFSGILVSPLHSIVVGSQLTFGEWMKLLIHHSFWLSPVAVDKVSLFLSKVNPHFLLQISFPLLLLGLCKYSPANRSFASAFLLLLHLSKQIKTKTQ